MVWGILFVLQSSAGHFNDIPVSHTNSVPYLLTIQTIWTIDWLPPC